jgi:hypothetical protein
MVDNATKMQALADKTRTGANLDVAKNVSQTVYDAGASAVPFTKLTKVGTAVKFGWDFYGGTQLGQSAIDAATDPPADISEFQKEIAAIDFGKVGTKPPEASGDPVEDYILDAKIRAMANVVNSTLANKKSSGANNDEYAALTRDLAFKLVLDMTVKDGPGTSEDEVTLPSFGDNPFKTALADEIKLIDPANPPTGPMGGIMLAPDDKTAFEAGDLDFAIGQYYGAQGLEPIIVSKDDKGALQSQLPLVNNAPVMATAPDYKPEQKALPSGWDGSVKSCPFLYAWNGTAFAQVNDIISVSRDVEREYLDSMLFAAKASADGRLELRVSEVRAEESFLDQIALRAVDVPDGYTAALSPDGRAYSVRDAASALSVSGVSASALTDVDGVGLKGYDGVGLTAQFAAPGRDAVLLLTVDGFQHDATRPVMSPKRPGVRVEAFADGAWTLVGEAHPRELADTTAFDVARFARAGRVKVRVTAVSCDTSVFQLIDRLALSTAPSGLARVRALAPRVSGPGRDTAASLRARDDDRVHLVPGQTITLTMPDPGADAYIIDSIGWYREL